MLRTQIKCFINHIYKTISTKYLNPYIITFLISCILFLLYNSDSLNGQTSGSGKIAPCKLLTSGQVNTVLTDSDGGYVAHSGGSLIKGVNSYQCTYSNDKWEMFSVYVTVAPNKKLFKIIKPDISTLKMIYNNFRKIKVGDQGWVYGDSGRMEVKIAKGYTIIHLKLISSNAGKKSDALVKLASVIVKKIK